ncbi:MAG: GNAT family N-acetyltransferase [Ornithinimicrobium sp.]
MVTTIPGSQRFFAAIDQAAATALGRTELGTGTLVVPDPQRVGSTSVVCYPRSGRTIIWTAPEMAERLADLARSEAMTLEEFQTAAAAVGGETGGTGTFRLLSEHPVDPAVLRQSEIRDLRRDQPEDRALIAAFIDVCSASDLEETELDLDDLDPHMLAVLDEEGAIAAYASGRPWGYDAAFDDVGVITRTDRRGHGLGASAVAAYTRRCLTAGRIPLYNCNDENIGSARLAEAVGFRAVQQVAAARFT